MLLRFNHPFKKAAVWLVPEHIIAAEELEKVPDELKDTANAKKTKYTMVHTSGKTAKFFVKESPGEINAILEKYVKKESPEFRLTLQHNITPVVEKNS